MDEKGFVGMPVRRSPGEVEELGKVHFRVNGVGLGHRLLLKTPMLLSHLSKFGNAKVV